MSAESEFATLDALKAEWDSLQPVQAEIEQRLWRKFRLEWNYHSNHIEGNTLTYGETQLLLLHDRATGDHALREFEEMKAHDVAIEHVRILAADRARPIAETDIRDLNRIILKEPFWKPAQTPDGKPTRKQIIPGEYKTTSNNVRTATNEVFEFASPDETRPRMQDLVRWLVESLANGSLHPVVLASKLHHDFVLIHPFDDGNGRVARLLMNYVLLRNGYPPVIIKSEDKPAYLTALRKADAGETNALAEYVAAALQWSLRLGIRAAKAESIEELSDVEKEVALFVRAQQASKTGEAMPSRQMVSDLITLSLKPFVEKVEAGLLKLRPLFSHLDVSVVDGLGSITNSINAVHYQPFEAVGPGQNLVISFLFRAYQGDALTPFDQQIEIGLHFPPAHYSISHNGQIVSFPYAKPILGEEADRLAARILADEFDRIKAKVGQAD